MQMAFVNNNIRLYFKLILIYEHNKSGQFKLSTFLAYFTILISRFGTPKESKSTKVLSAQIIDPLVRILLILFI